jgi:TetR/AcrR family tetracycline transcriptional repressor
VSTIAPPVTPLGAPARATLTRPRVLEAALAYADRYGLEALSMHKLGVEVGVKAMSLYNHVKDKDDVLDGLVELLWSEVPAETPASGDWRSAMRHLAMSLRAVVRRHPHVAPLIMTRQLMPERALQVCEHYLEVMRKGNVPEECAVAFLRTVFSYGFGHALAELSCLPGGSAHDADCDDLAKLRRVTALVPPEVPDHLVRIALKVCGDCDMEAQFVIGLDLMIRGLDAYLDSLDTPASA